MTNLCLYVITSYYSNLFFFVLSSSPFFGGVVGKRLQTSHKKFHENQLINIPLLVDKTCNCTEGICFSATKQSSKLVHIWIWAHSAIKRLLCEFDESIAKASLYELFSRKSNAIRIAFANSFASCIWALLKDIHMSYYSM